MVEVRPVWGRHKVGFGLVNSRLRVDMSQGVCCGLVGVVPREPLDTP